MNYKITQDDLKDLQIKAIGYKILHPSLVAHDYAYGKKGENIVGNVYKTTDIPVMCSKGFHCSSNPLATFRYYSPNTNDRFFKVRLYGTVMRGYDKDVGSIIEFVEEYSFDEFLDVIRQYYINEISCTSFLTGANHSRNFKEEMLGILNSDAIADSCAVVSSRAISSSKAIACSNSVADSTNIYYSDAISYSQDVHASTNIINSYAIYKSQNVSLSIGVGLSEQIFDGIAISNCSNLRNSLFCYDKHSNEDCLFNIKVTPARIQEVKNRFLRFNWQPTITMSAGRYRKSLNWNEIPDELLHYIINLEEFDPFIWGRIVGEKI